MGYAMQSRTPATAIHDSLDGRRTNAEFLGELACVAGVRAESLVALPNAGDLFFGQFRRPIAFAGRAVCRLRVTSASLRDFVLRVFVGRSRPEMSGIAARRIVATVANEHSFGDGSNPEFVGEPMRTDHLAANLEVSVPGLTVLGTEPRPASVGTTGAVNMRDESFVNRAYAWRHQRGPFSLVTPRPFAAARGLFVPAIIPPGVG